MNALQRTYETHMTNRAGLLIDVGAVAYADGAGVDALLRMERGGARVAGARGFVAEMLERGRQAAQQAPGAGGAPARNGTAGTVRPACDRDETSLIASLRAGDDAAYALVVRRYGPRLLAVARRLLNSDDDARDALQDAFLSAFRNVGSFTAGSRLSTWLHRIVVNAALMRLRSRRRRPEDPIEDLLPRFAADGHWLEAPTAWRSDELLERQEMRALVRRCIEQLPERHRAILVLRDIEDLDTGEVAELLGITPNAAKVRLHRARQALRTLIERARVSAARAS
jgi:RNA polymerase sigma-70 factor (ECF subfamily)